MFNITLFFYTFLVKLDWEGAGMQVSSDVQLQLHSRVCIHHNSGFDLYSTLFSTRYLNALYMGSILHTLPEDEHEQPFYNYYLPFLELLVFSIGSFFTSDHVTVPWRADSWGGDVVYILAFWDEKKFSERDERANRETNRSGMCEMRSACYSADNSEVKSSCSLRDCAHIVHCLWIHGRACRQLQLSLRHIP